MKKAAFIVFVLLMAVCCAAFTACLYPSSLHKVDYGKLELIWQDEFDTFNTEYWHSEDDGVRRGGYWDIGQVSVKDGMMVITTEYKEDGAFGPGWYTGSVYTRDTFTMESGYAEVRCKMPAGAGHWGAFWLSSTDMVAGGDGTEIDVVESAYYNDPYNPSWYKETVFHTIHAQGYGDKHKVKQSGYYHVGDIYNEFHTYGVEWNEEGYTFYIDGERTWKTSFCPATAQEYLWLSVEISGEMTSADPANPENVYTWGGEITSNGGNDFKSEFIIDYVRCYNVIG